MNRITEWFSWSVNNKASESVLAIDELRCCAWTSGDVGLCIDGERRRFLELSPFGYHLVRALRKPRRMAELVSASEHSVGELAKELSRLWLLGVLEIGGALQGPNAPQFEFDRGSEASVSSTA